MVQTTEWPSAEQSMSDFVFRAMVLTQLIRLLISQQKATLHPIPCFGAWIITVLWFYKPLLLGEYNVHLGSKSSQQAGTPCGMGLQLLKEHAAPNPWKDVFHVYCHYCCCCFLFHSFLFSSETEEKSKENQQNGNNVNETVEPVAKKVMIFRRRLFYMHTVSG